MNGRGQGLVEMALGLLVFVTVLIFGIHFAEVGYLSLKATEAATHASWDATGMRAHRFSPNGTQVFNSNQMRKGFPSQNAEGIADARYSDFDGRSSSNGQAQLTHVFTRATNLDVSCRPEALATFNGYVNNPGNIELVFTFPTNNAGRKVDGQSCNASAELRGFNMPTTFFETPGNGYFKERHYRNAGIKVCAYGRPNGVGGPCNGRLSMVLGDWGFAGTAGLNLSAEWDECRVDNGCENQGYWRSVERLYVANGSSGGSASSDLAAMVSGSASPTQESTFHMVFYGEYNTNTKEMHHRLSDESGAMVEWEITPSRAGSGYEAAYQNREQCFLGKSCADGVF